MKMCQQLQETFFAKRLFFLQYTQAVYPSVIAQNQFSDLPSS